MLAVSGERPVPRIFLVYALLCCPETLDNGAMIRRECYTPMTKHGGAIKGPGREAAAGACYGMSRRGSAVPAPILESPLPARRGHRRESFGRDRGSDSGDASGVQTGPQELKHSTEVSDRRGRTLGLDELGVCAPESESVVSLLLPTREGGMELGLTWRLRSKARSPANAAGRSPPVRLECSAALLFV